jgi:light-regulated signal transduction histidine kinase (bacteriophytochrome)
METKENAECPGDNNVQLKIKKLEFELKQAHQDLQDFTYIVSHDLRAPLRGITSLANWLQEDYSDCLGQDGQAYLKKLMIRTQRMNRMIEGVLQYSRLGRVKLMNQEFSSQEAVSDTINRLVLPPGITVHFAATLPTIYYDRGLFIQVLEQLMGNGILHLGKPSGQVILSCRAIQKEQLWEFCVKDDGKGIDTKQSERIFKPFQTLAPASESEGEALGMGLSLVKKIVERYGGSIWLESTPGMGSAFYFTVPVNQEAVEGEIK